MKILEAFVSLQLRRIEVAHTKVKFCETLEREEVPHLGFEGIHRRQFSLDFLTLGRNHRRVITLILFSVHFPAIHNRIVL